MTTVSVNINSARPPPPLSRSLYQGLSHRQQREDYGVPSPPPPSAAPLFQDTSGVPSYPPMSGPQQLLTNPVVAATAMHYSQELASRGQAYVDQNVGTRVMSTQCIILGPVGYAHTHSSHTPSSHPPPHTHHTTLTHHPPPHSSHIPPSHTYSHHTHTHHTHHPHTSPCTHSHIRPRLNVLFLCRD